MNIADVLTDRAEEFGDKDAVVFSEQKVSFTQLKDSTFRLANGLEALGLTKGVAVAIYLPNSPEYIASYFAIYSLAGIVVPLDFMLTQQELENFITHSQARVLITKGKRDIDLNRLKQNTNLENIILLGESQEFIGYHNLIEENCADRPGIEICDGDYSTIFYTSGSTGHPKGVLLNYRHLQAPVDAAKHFLTISSQDTVLCPIPLSHSAGWAYILFSLCLGMTLVLQERFSPLESVKKIKEYNVNFICLVPSMYVAILGLKEFETFLLDSLRFVIVFGAPSSSMLLRRFHQACPNAYLLNGWGMTEICPPNAVTPLGSDKIESVGKPVPWMQIKILDESGMEVPVGQIGELVISGWVVMEGYYREAELTRAAIRDGWFYTGDLARMDSEGYLYIVGRKKEMIKVAGEIVYAPELEEVIHRHPKVSEVAVIGVYDKLRGEVPKAFLKLRKDEALTEEELRSFCRQHLAHFKIPHYFEFVKELPKTRSGKINKQALRSVESSDIDEIPNSKSQIPNKLQITIPND